MGTPAPRGSHWHTPKHPLQGGPSGEQHPSVHIAAPQLNIPSHIHKMSYFISYKKIS